MRALFLFLLCLVLPVHAEELQLSTVLRSATHADTWKVAAEAVRRTGNTAVLREVPPERALVMANAGGTDGDVGRTGSVEQYPNLVQVPESIYNYAPSVFSYRPVDVNAGWESLRGHSICIRVGFRLTEKRTRGIARHMLADEISILRMLKAGGCELAIMDRRNDDARAAMAADPALRRMEPPLEEMPLYIYLNKKHAALVPKLAEALRQMRQDGTMQRLLAD